MKFLCGNCKAKYQIADEKVSGRTLRMKCRRCGHDILIDGHSMTGTSPAPAAPAAGSTRRTGTGMSSLVPGVARGGSSAQPLPPRPPAAAGLPRPTASRSKPPSALGAEFRRHVAAPPEVPQRSAPYDLWHAAIKDVPVGPMTRDELARKIDAGAVTAESLCWREGMDDWRPLDELPELSQLLRRGREGSWSGRPPPRHRPPPHVPAPQGARPSQYPAELEEPEEDYGEPTRIADLQHIPNAPALVAQGHAASGTSPRIVVPQVATSPAAAIEAAPAPARPARGASGLTTGIAVGLLVGILLVGGPILYRNTYGTPAPAPAQQGAVQPTPAKQAEPVGPDLQLELPSTDEEKPRNGPATKPSKPSGTQVGKAKVDVEGKEEGGKKLSEQERKLLERMGIAGSGEVNLDDKKKPVSEAVASGPTLTSNQLMKVVQDNKVQLQRCYETALRASGGRQDGAIKITVSAVVGTSGTVTQVTTQGTGLGNMTDCMKQAVKRWRFPQSGGESEFAFPLVFQPGA